MNGNRTLAWDWFPGAVPENVVMEEAAYLETTYSFQLCRSLLPEAVHLGRGSSVYLGVMFDLGSQARVTVGDFTLMNGSRVICDGSITIGDYCLISWNTVLMDTYRAPVEPQSRAAMLRAAANSSPDRLVLSGPVRPIAIGHGVWIGFDAVVLPGVSVGDGAIVGARSVVREDVPPFSVVAGNPARVIRYLDAQESQRALAEAMERHRRGPS